MQLAKAAATLNEHGARQVFAIVTHGILSGNAIETINQSCLSGLVVTNSKSSLYNVVDLLLTTLIAVPRKCSGPRASPAAVYRHVYVSL